MDLTYNSKVRFHSFDISLWLGHRHLIIVFDYLMLQTTKTATKILSNINIYLYLIIMPIITQNYYVLEPKKIRSEFLKHHTINYLNNFN